MCLETLTRVCSFLSHRSNLDAWHLNILAKSLSNKFSLISVVVLRVSNVEAKRAETGQTLAEMGNKIMRVVQNQFLQVVHTNIGDFQKGAA